MKTIHDKRVEAAVQAMEEHRHVMVTPGPHRCSCGEVLDGWAAAHKKHVANVALEAADAVVTEEQVKWQYGLQDSDGFVGFRNLSLKSLRKRAKRTGEMIVRRRPATKWEEVSSDPS